MSLGAILADSHAFNAQVVPALFTSDADVRELKYDPPPPRSSAESGTTHTTRIAIFPAKHASDFFYDIEGAFGAY